jgi:hypothetical protein
MPKHAKKENTAAAAVKHLNNLTFEFNNGARPERAGMLLEALAKFVERQDADKQLLAGDLESVMQWVDTVKKLLLRALELEASNKDGTRSAAARGNIEMALGILTRLNDPVFASSCKKKSKAAPHASVRKFKG